MGWIELMAWVKAMRRQTQGEQTSPDSWAGAEKDPWWAEQHKKRDEERRG